MRKPVFLLLLVSLLNVTVVFSESSSIISTNNQYNGKSVETLFDKNDKSNFVIKISHYDNEDRIRQIDLTPVESLMAETGIAKQVMLLDQDENVTQYNIDFTDEYLNAHGINRLIEFVDSDDNVVRQEWYRDNLFVDFLEDLDISSRFPFYKLSFLVREVLEDYQGETTGKEVFTSSARYRGIRTVVNIGKDIEPLTETDKKIITYIGRTLGNDNVLQYYSSKTYVEEDGVKYCLYIQNGLERHILENDFSTIRYYFIGYNDNLYLALITLTTYD